MHSPFSAEAFESAVTSLWQDSAVAKPLDSADGAHAEGASRARDLRRNVVLIDDEPRPGPDPRNL